MYSTGQLREEVEQGKIREGMNTYICRSMNITVLLLAFGVKHVCSHQWYRMMFMARGLQHGEKVYKCINIIL